MDGYLNKGIKEVIKEFPQVGILLNEAGIGCVTCSVGTCLLKDVISIHGLPKAQERAVMAKITKVIDPDADIDIPDTDTAAEIPAMPQTIKYSPPVKRLVEEHDRIKRLLALIPYIVFKIQQEAEMDADIIEHCAFFIQNYADKYHHAKEEDILFKYTDESRDIIQVMLEDHRTGRNFVKQVLAGLTAGRRDDVINGLESYRELLTQHIKKEDDILYPWIDRTLSTRQVGEMLSSFNEADEDFYLSNITEQFDAFLDRVENSYRQELK
jgi:hemerythrin-like domain-containing protein